MRKNLRKAFYALFAVAIISTTLTACNDNDDNIIIPTETTVPIVAFGIADYYQAIEFVDLTLSYTNVKGESVTETIIKTPYKVVLAPVSTPYTGSFTLTATRKSGVEIDENAKYDAGKGVSLIYALLNIETEKYSSVKASPGNIVEKISNGIQGDRFEEFLENNILGTHVFSISSN